VNWLDNYITKNENGYLISELGGLFVDVGDDYVRNAKGNNDSVNLREISKDEFIKLLIS
jgi:hypothetical protein